MSAIVGMVDWRGGPAGPTVRLGLATLAGQGRDGEGFWDGGPVALGWRQTILSAEDRADVQPLTGGGGRFRMVFEGRLDNRADLARLLSLRPDQAFEWSDSRFVLAAFETWGKDCGARLLGEFAFAVWDEVRHELVLVRDHLGFRPLAYYEGQGFFAFASSPNALFAMPGVPREIDEDIIVRTLLFETSREEQTFFRTIRRVACAHALTATSKGNSTSCYWRIENTPDVRFKRDDDYVEAMRHLLDEAVGSCLRTIHPVGSHLSSGWDSTAVTAIAAGLMAKEGRTLHAFTSVPAAGWKATRQVQSQIADEAPLAALVAGRFDNIEHTLIHNVDRFDFAALDWYAECFARPRYDVNNAGWYDLMHRSARDKGVRVMLTGASGNRTTSHAGVDRYAKLLRSAKFATFAAEWLAARRRGWSTKSLIGASLHPFMSDQGWDVLLRLMGRVRNNFVVQVMLDPSYVRERQIGWHPPKGEVGRAGFQRQIRRSQFERWTRSGCDSVLGQALAAWDMDLRDPLWDRRIVEFCYGAPDDQFLKDGQRRRMLRRTMAGMLPEEIFEERRRGRQAADWYVVAARSQAMLSAEIDLLAKHPLMSVMLDIARMRKLLATWAPEKIAAEPRDYFACERLLEAISVGRFVRLHSACPT
jgi:asparagine synthase (glutamine-hydrolysing)